MGIKFSDSTNKDGLVEKLGRATGTQDATTASYPLKVKTLDINSTLAFYMLLAIKAGGRMQVDDTNQTDYPVITTDMVNGQQDYPIVQDGSSTPNQILDIRQVRIKDANGQWITLTEIDREVDNIGQWDNQTGTPTHYDLDSNAVKFYPTPNYDSTGGIELYISRTPTYFVSTDTTKKAGIPDLFHDYLWMRPAYLFCLEKTLPQTAGLGVEVKKFEDMIQDYYSRRDRTSGGGKFTTRQSGVDSSK